MVGPAVLQGACETSLRGHVRTHTHTVVILALLCMYVHLIVQKHGDDDTAAGVKRPFG